MKPGLEYFRSDVVDALGLTVGQWNAGIREVKESGAVVQRGERRGARYGRVGRWFLCSLILVVHIL